LLLYIIGCGLALRGLRPIRQMVVVTASALATAAAAAAGMIAALLHGAPPPAPPPPSAAWGGGAVTAVLFTSREDRRGFPRLPLLLGSLCHHLSAPGLLEELVVVAPDRDTAYLRAGLGISGQPKQGAVTSSSSSSSNSSNSLWADAASCHPPWPVRVLADSQVLPSARAALEALTAPRERSARGGRGAGYRLQMLLKLGAARVVRTRHLLTLDSDAFAAREVRLGDLLADAEGGGWRARVQADGVNQRTDWWRAAAAILSPPAGQAPRLHRGGVGSQGAAAAQKRQLQQCLRMQHGGLSMGVTPAVLDVGVARQLLRRLERLYGAAAVSSFLAVVVTEIDLCNVCSRQKY
jgi:hypothetical protein